MHLDKLELTRAKSQEENKEYFDPLSVPKNSE